MKVNPETGLLDYDELQRRVDLFKPNMIICGGSAYPREWDYARFRAIADTCGAYLLCDMAHIRYRHCARRVSERWCFPFFFVCSSFSSPLFVNTSEFSSVST